MSSTTTNYSIISLVFSLIAGFLVLLEDFAGWTENTYYGTNDYYVFIGSENAPAFGQLMLVLIAAGLFGVSYFSFLGVNNRLGDRLQQAIVLNIGVIVLIVLGTIIFFIEAADAVEAWLETGFYGGLIGSVLSLLFLVLQRD